MNKPIKQFKLFSLKHFSLKDNALDEIHMIDISDFIPSNPNIEIQSEQIEISFDMDRIAFLNCITKEKAFEQFVETQKKEFMQALFRNTNPCKINFSINNSNILHILSTQKNNSTESLNIYIIAKQFNFKFIRTSNEKSFSNDLFIFRNFLDEIDNLKYLVTVFSFEIVFDKDIFLNFIQRRNLLITKEKKIIRYGKKKELLSSILEDCFSSTPIILYFLAIISDNIITYYEILDFFKENSDEILQVIASNKENFIRTLKYILQRNSTLQKKFLSKESFNEQIKERINLLNGKSQDLLNAEDYSKQHRVETYRINFNPINCYFAKPLYEISNRVMRKFSSNEEMIRLSLKSAEGGQLKSKCEFTQLFIQYRLRKGIVLNKKLYEFFGYSNSQFRAGSCWLCVGADEIRKKCGDFSNICK